MLSQGTNDLREVVPLIADLLSISTGDRYPPIDLKPQKRKEKTLAALIAQVEGLSAKEPGPDGIRGRPLERCNNEGVARSAD